MSTAPLQLGVIVGSTRPGRIGREVADWFAAIAERDARFETHVLDLAEIDLPLFDESSHPALGTYEHDHTRRWSELVGAMDAFVFVIPEYNGGFPASVKNAIDFLHREWRDKAAAIVSYGGGSGGLRAALMLRQVLNVLRMHAVLDAVTLRLSEHLDPERRLVPDATLDQQANRLLGELARISVPLRTLRHA